MSTQHQLYSSPETVHWGFFDASLSPVLHVDSGDQVTFHSVSGEPEDMPADPSRVLPELREIHNRCQRGPGPHILTGPVWINRACKGDTLEVRILKCILRQDWGWNLILPGRGTLPEDAYTLCSLALELHVTQLVDVNKGIHAMMAKHLLSA